MNLHIELLPFGKRTEPRMPDIRIFEYLKEEGVRKLVSDHYDLLVQSKIKHLFPTDNDELERAKMNSADFFIQRLGGPDYFNQRRGKPMLAGRHARFQISPESRIVWLECYREVLHKLHIPEHLIQSYWDWLHDFSNWMVNTPADRKIVFDNDESRN
ncbi:MAG TPA: globin [Bacteroidales bacterium]|nr:globin [Bacteroidales bacterium]